MIDFDRLCLVPAEQTFGKPIVVTPIKSQPDNPAPYAARGIFSSQPLDVPMQDGSIFSDQQTSLGIRLAEYPIPPVRGDLVEYNGTTYWVLDTDEDGQGDCKLQLRKNPP
jgi:hypothetical protein